MSLPEADATTRAAIVDWLDRFSALVRAVDFDGARAMWDPDVVAFGTRQDFLHGIDALATTQWGNVWPVTSAFRIATDGAVVLAAPGGDLAVAAVTWTSTGYDAAGTAFDRPGRATLMLRRDASGWRCIHSHMSLFFGVPQRSHGPRGASPAD